MRHHGDVARIEAGPAESARVLADAAGVARELGALGFARVLLDVEGYRRGALNEGLGLVRLKGVAEAGDGAADRAGGGPWPTGVARGAA